jgi:hypothetical protein
MMNRLSKQPFSEWGSVSIITRTELPPIAFALLRSIATALE